METNGNMLARCFALIAFLMPVTVQFVIKPTEQYHRHSILDDGISAKAQRAETEELAIPFSPCLKQTTCPGN